MYFKQLIGIIRTIIMSVKKQENMDFSWSRILLKLSESKLWILVTFFAYNFIVALTSWIVWLFSKKTEVSESNWSISPHKKTCSDSELSNSCDNFLNSTPFLRTSLGLKYTKNNYNIVILNLTESGELP